MTALIVEDEPAGRKILIELIHTYCSSVEVIAAVPTVAEAVDAINNHKPDLIFLDIELPRENGLRLFSYFKKPDFKVIITTSYDSYAIDAFRQAAIDYLLKPISGQDLLRAVSRVQSQRMAPSSKIISELHSYLKKETDRISVATLNGYDFYPLNNVIRAEAEGRYTTIYLKNGFKIVSTKNIGEYEKTLSIKGFYRTHRSHLVNLAFICKYRKGNMPLLELEDGSIIPVSSKKKEILIKLLKDYFN